MPYILKLAAQKQKLLIMYLGRVMFASADTGDLLCLLQLNEYTAIVSLRFAEVRTGPYPLLELQPPSFPGFCQGGSREESL